MTLRLSSPLKKRLSSLFFFCLLFFFFLSLSVSSSSSVSAVPRAWDDASVTPCMCLEMCNEDVQDDLKDLLARGKTVRSVVFSAWVLGPSSTLLWGNYSNVDIQLSQYGFGTFAIISSTNLSDMRSLFQNPNSFIQQAVSVAQQNRYSGFTINFQPTTTPTAADGAAFISFLNMFASKLHRQKGILEVNIGSSDGALYQYSSLGNSNVDYLVSMGTGCGNFTLFKERSQYLISTIPIQKLIIGLLTTNPDTSQPFQVQDIHDRFAFTRSQGVKHVHVWTTPIPDFWWTLINWFIHA